MAEKTKTLKVEQIAAAGRIVFALCDDGSIWQYGDDNEWDEIPAIEVVDESDEPSDD